MKDVQSRVDLFPLDEKHKLAKSMLLCPWLLCVDQIEVPCYGNNDIRQYDLCSYCGAFNSVKCFTEEKFQNRHPNVRQVRGNGKEAIHPTAIWQTEKSKLNFIIWYVRTVLLLVCVLFMSTSRIQRACWRIVYMIVSLFFLVLVFPLFSWLQPLFNRYFSSGLTFFSPVKRKKSFADRPTDYFFDI